jgi:hypothetical protein
MAVGDGLATDAERDMARRERKREAWELDNFPSGEIDEMVELYVAKVGASCFFGNSDGCSLFSPIGCTGGDRQTGDEHPCEVPGML